LCFKIVKSLIYFLRVNRVIIEVSVFPVVVMALTKYIESSTGYSGSTVANVLESFFMGIQTSLRQGEKIQFQKFGTFSIKDLPEREARNPRTGETITVAPLRKPVFKFSKEFAKLIQPDALAKSEGVALEKEIGIAAPVSDPLVSVELIPFESPEPVPQVTVNELKSPPPIPAFLLSPVRTWHIKGSNGVFVELPESELKSAGVTGNTPIWSDRTGWKLVKDVPELAHLLQ
jgi:DNA-binding protein HU-beta